MRAITLDNVFENKQHRSILDMLEQHPEGLTLQELTYLLTENKITYKYSEMLKLGRTRKNVFSSRQRIQDCLTNLKILKLVIKIGKRYVLTKKSPMVQSLVENIKVLEHIFRKIRYGYEHFKGGKNQKSELIKRFGQMFVATDSLPQNSFVEEKIQIYECPIDRTNNEQKNKLDKIIQKMKESLDELEQLVKETHQDFRDSLIRCLEDFSYKGYKIADIESLRDSEINSVKKACELMEKTWNVTVVMNINKKEDITLINLPTKQ